MSERALIVDDEANMRWVLTEALKTAGFDARSVSSGQEALASLAQAPCELVILDQKLKGMDGLSTLRAIRERWPEIIVLVLTAYGTVAHAVEAMQLGAADYLRKPFDVDELLFKLQRALERRALQSEIQRLRIQTLQNRALDPVGSHPRFRQMIEVIRSLSVLSSDFLLVGEVGTGKATLARWSHAISPRKHAPLIEVDVRTMPGEHLVNFLASEGNREGGSSRAGMGTLILRHVQALDVLYWNKLHHYIASRNHPFHPCVILTSETPLPEDVTLQLPQVLVPPLREHSEDCVQLVEYFAPSHKLTPSALSILEQSTWPGNIAELRHVIERAVALAGSDSINGEHLPDRLGQSLSSKEPVRLPAEGVNLEMVEVSLIRQALARTGGNKTRAAELLGLTRHTLLYRLEKYGVESPE